jgi:hypothetical protein
MKHAFMSSLKPFLILSLFTLNTSCFLASGDVDNPAISGALIQKSGLGEPMNEKINELSKTLNLYKNDRQGGGDFGFEIQNQKDHYLLQINHANFKSFAAGEKVLKILKETSDPQARKVGEKEILSLMQGSCEWVLQEPPPACPGCATGTWKKEYIQYFSTDNQANEKIQPIFGSNGCSESVDFLKIETLARTLVGES